MRAVFSACKQAESRQILGLYEHEYRHVRPFTTGNDLRALGLPPSPRYEVILSSLKNAWLDGNIQSEGEEKVLLQKLLEQ